MKTTHNQAIEILKNGNEQEAWEVAKQDEGLLPEVTKEQWLDFAKKVLAERENEPKSYKQMISEIKGK